MPMQHPRQLAGRIRSAVSSRRWRRIVTVLLVVDATMACAGIRQDEYLCENAVSHLTQCCPGFPANQVDCTYVPAQGCESHEVDPQIGPSTAECILHKGCADLQAEGSCDDAGACR
jgi:hypothetical protein